MKILKMLLVLVVFSVLCLPAYAARERTINGMQIESYSDTGTEASIEITLSGTPGTLTTVTLPTTAKGFKLFPRNNHIRFAVYSAASVRTLAAVATDSDGTVAAADLAIGGIAKNDQWETRLLPSYDGTNARKLTLRSTTASVVVDLEVF